jgi:hypothetical protein
VLPYYFLFANLAVVAGKLDLKGAGLDVGFAMAAVYQDCGAAYSMSLGHCGILAGWSENGELRIMRPEARGSFAVRAVEEARARDFQIAPIGFLITEGEELYKEMKAIIGGQTSGEFNDFNFTPKMTPLKESGDFVALSSYNIPKNEALFARFCEKLVKGNTRQDYAAALCDMHEPAIDDCMSLVLLKI